MAGVLKCPEKNGGMKCPAKNGWLGCAAGGGGGCTNPPCTCNTLPCFISDAAILEVEFALNISVYWRFDSDCNEFDPCTELFKTYNFTDAFDMTWNVGECRFKYGDPTDGLAGGCFVSPGAILSDADTNFLQIAAVASAGAAALCSPNIWGVWFDTTMGLLSHSGPRGPICAHTKLPAPFASFSCTGDSCDGFEISGGPGACLRHDLFGGGLGVCQSGDPLSRDYYASWAYTQINSFSITAVVNNNPLP